MMFHPGIMALLLGSSLTACMLCYSTYEGARIIQSWDIHSGSEIQLELEKRTYLISTVMTYAMGFQFLSLFLFIYTADSLSPLFVGAMCAAGSLHVNGFGYPTLLLKIVSCLLAGLWLIVNYTDNKAYDYPLIRIKYWMLFFITPFLIAESIIQGGYLLRLKPNIITSCCAVLFSSDAKTVISDFLVLPLTISQVVFFLSSTVTMILGFYVYVKQKGAGLYSIVSFVHFIISITALISFIGVYIYELPTHHCPFCILHQEYGYQGYYLYLAIFVGAISGIGTGVVHPFKKNPSLRNVIPKIQKRLALVSIIAIAVFVLLAGYDIVFSNLSMEAY